MEDWRLLRQFVDQGSQTAFARLVERHRGLVYSTCQRELGDSGLAEDATQAVFLVLARKARSLRREVVLSGWLFQAARFTARDLRKSERRRQAREEQAGVEMHRAAREQDEVWREIDPWLHDSLDRLGPRDRDAILLRFFEGKDFAEVALALGLKEDAARHRVSRALDKMRRFLSSRGVTVTVTTLGALLAANALGPASDLEPASSVGSPAPAGIPAGPELVGPRLYHLTQGVLRTMWMRQLGGLTAALVIGLAVFGAGAGLVWALTPITRPSPKAPLTRAAASAAYATSTIAAQARTLPRTPRVRIADAPAGNGPTAPAARPLQVSEIRITGNRVVPAGAVIAALGFRAGDTVSDARIQRALTHVYNLAWFNRVGPSRLEPRADGGYILTLPVRENPGLDGTGPAEFQELAEIGAVYDAAEDALRDHRPARFAAMFSPNFLATDNAGRQETRDPYLTQFDGPLGPAALIEVNHYVTGSRRSGSVVAVCATVTRYRWTRLPGSPDTGCEQLEQSVEDDWRQSNEGWVLDTRKATSDVKETENPAGYIRLIRNRAARGGAY